MSRTLPSSSDFYEPGDDFYAAGRLLAFSAECSPAGGEKDGLACSPGIELETPTTALATDAGIDEFESPVDKSVNQAMTPRRLFDEVEPSAADPEARVRQRSVEQVRDVPSPSPRVVILQERVQLRSAEQVVDVPVPPRVDEITEIQHSLVEQVVGVPAQFPQVFDEVPK